MRIYLPVHQEKFRMHCQQQSFRYSTKKISEVGSLSAAAVHELSTPLNTIFLILNDLLKEKILIDDKNIIKDINLLKSEAERCSRNTFKII